MCERTCPNCGCSEHGELATITGVSIVCNNCLTVLAHQADEDAANTDLTYWQREQWARDNSFVLEGAEAKNPEHDKFYTEFRL